MHVCAACFRVAMFSYGKTLTHFVSNSIGILTAWRTIVVKQLLKDHKSMFKKKLSLQIVLRCSNVKSESTS